MDNTKEIQLLSIGDASMDVFISPIESDTLCQIDTKECFVAFSYGDKIPVKNLEFSVGGNAANNAVGATRLGIKTGIVLSIGADSIGEMISSKLENEKVDTTFVIRQEGTVSNYSTIVNYSGERTIFSYHAPRSYEFPVNLPKPVWVYLTSMGETFLPFYKHVIDWLIKNPEIKLAFNPGSYQFKAGLEAIKPVMERANIIFVNRHEAEDLTGMKESGGEEKVLLRNLSSLGPKISVITDGNNGSFIFDGGRFVQAPIFPIDSFERTGAGDAFGSGCLSAIIKGKTLEEALVWGTLNSTSVIGYTGSQRGLLKEEEMAEWLERYKSAGIVAKEF